MDQVVLNLHFGESFAAFDQLVEGVVCANLEEDVNVLVVLEYVLELDDVVVVEGFVDLDLGYQLKV